MPKLTSSKRRRRPKEERPPLRELVRFFFPFMRPYWKEFCLATVALLLGTVSSLLRPWPFKVVIDLVLSRRHHHTRVPLIGGWLSHARFAPMEIVYGALVATLLIGVLSAALRFIFLRAMGYAAQHFIFDLRRTLFAHMQRLSLRFHDSQRTGDLTTRLITDIQTIQQLILTSVDTLSNTGLQMFGMLALMLWLDWRYTLVAISAAPLFFPLAYGYGRLIKRASLIARKNTGLMASLAQEALSSIRIVQGLGQEGQIDERFGAHNQTYRGACLQRVRYRAQFSPLATLIRALGRAVVVFYGAVEVLAGKLTTGDAVIFYTYAANFYRPTRRLGQSLISYNRAMVAVERILDVMNARSEVGDRAGACPAPRLRGQIEFRDVWFEYEPGQPILSHINLTVRAGEKVALVGATGAGKSTLVSLVPRFYDPAQGAVLIDGQDIRNYTLASLRDQISLILQDSLLFNGTIRENIAFGCPAASDQQIAAAARTANADEFIHQLAKSYDTAVSERGTTLSGGQKRRIAVARAVLREAPIIILDEPTTGLDAASECFVVEALERAVAGRTALIIAHHLATVRFADRIVVLDQGRIIEQGSHAELLSRKGAYARLYNLQAPVEDEDELVSTAGN